MFDLVKFEFKKIISRKSTRVFTFGLFVLIAVIASANVFQQRYSDSNLETVTALDAIAVFRENAELNTKVMTDEQVTDDIIEFNQRHADYEVDPEKKSHEFTVYLNVNDHYLRLLLGPWSRGAGESLEDAAARVDTSREVDLRAAARSSVEAKLDYGMGGTWVYSDAEREYWTAKYDETAAPVEYGYAKGWAELLACSDFLFLVLVAACFSIAPVFSAEYQQRTDAVILATKYGKGTLACAKVIAALVFITLVFIANAAIMLGILLSFYGADGASLPVQVIGLAIPYSMTIGQAVATVFGIAYLITLGITALTLLLSAKLRSTLSVFGIGVVIILVAQFLPSTHIGILDHILYLLPFNGLNTSMLFIQMISYPLGPIVLDYQSAMALFQVGLMAACIPLAMRIFKTHQVS